MKKGTYAPPSNKLFYILDGITGVILVLELHSIISGLITCLQWGRFEWYPLCSIAMLLLMMGCGIVQLGMAYWLLLIGFNLCHLYWKTKLCVHRTFVYRRTNALFIQVLFLACTAVCLIAVLDYSRF